MRSVENPVLVSGTGGGAAHQYGPTVPGKPGWFCYRNATGVYIISVPGAKRIVVGSITGQGGVGFMQTTSTEKDATSATVATDNTSAVATDITFNFTMRVWY